MPLADRRLPQGGDWLSREQLAAITPDGPSIELPR